MQLLYAGYYNPNNPYNGINNIIKYIAAPILTEEDFSSFCRLSKNKHSSDYAYFGGLQKITTELYKSNPEPPTLTFINFNGQIACNFYVLGVILRKMNFLKQFVFPDKDGSIKDLPSSCRRVARQAEYPRRNISGKRSGDSRRKGRARKASQRFIDV